MSGDVSTTVSSSSVRDSSGSRRNVALALDELRYFTTHVDILGVYPADRARG